MTAPRPTPGWYPDPAGSPNLRWFDGNGWAVHAAPLPSRPKQSRGWPTWLTVILSLLAAVVLLSFVVAVGTDANKPVSETHSDNPDIETFYRKVDALGLGDLKSKDALRWAEDVCDNGNPLVLWLETDTSMVKSIEFSTAALGICDEVRS